MSSGDSAPSMLALLAELTYPEYRHRHIFTARLRLLLFCCFLVFYAITMHDHIPPQHPAMMIFLGACMVTMWCYYNIIVGKWMIFSFVLEVAADLLGLSVVIYLLGGALSEHYLLFLCYCLVGGLFYNYRVATFLALATFITYLVFFWLTAYGLIPDAPVHLSSTSHVTHFDHAWVHLVILGSLLPFTVYAVKMAQSFNMLREHALEARNRELTALQNLGGMIRTTAPLHDVVQRVLQGLMGGLDLAGCLLLLVDSREGKLNCYTPPDWEQLHTAETALGISLSGLSLPLASEDSLLLQKIRDRTAVYRHDLATLLEGMEPAPDPERMRRLQEQLELRKAIAIPLVAEGELLGAFIGLSRESFVAERAVATLEIFANQAALVLRVTMLIEALKHSNRELLEANRVKSEFLATMSHELRTPLTAIIGFSELLIEGTMGKMTEEQEDSLREILNNGSNLLELINNILDLARMESGRLSLSFERFDLRELLERTQRALRPLIERKDLQCKLEVPADLTPVMADERRINQVVLNLMGNAIKFTPDNGSITMRARNFASLSELNTVNWKDRPILEQYFLDGGYLIEVQDSGIGIPPQQLESIFEMFKQVDSSVTRSYEGTGLGLALVRQLVELHHGDIWVESAEGKGAHFFVILPSDPTIDVAQRVEAQTRQSARAVPGIHMPR